MHQSPKLKQKCIDFIGEHQARVERTDGWMLLTVNQPGLAKEVKGTPKEEEESLVHGAENLTLE